MRLSVVSTVASSGDSAGIVIPSVLTAAVLLAAFWLWVLVDVLSWPRATWDAAGLSKTRWVVRVVLLGGVGAAFYLLSPRRELRAAYRSIRWRD